MVKLRPTRGYVLIEPIELETKTSAGIILPETHAEKSQRGKVIAVGKTQVGDSSKIIVPEFKTGDVVIYKKWGGEEVKLTMTGKEYVFVPFQEVLAIVK